jgi:MFS family permease
MPVLGGFLNDRLPRRQLLLGGSALMLVVMCAVTAVYAFGELKPWHILLAGVFHGGLLGVDWTTRQTLLPAVVSRRRLVSAVAIDLGVFNLARIVAPLIGGMVLALWNGTAAYGLIAGLFAANTLVITALSRGASIQRGRPGGGRAAIWNDSFEALRAAGSQPVIGINIAFTAVNGLLLGGIVYLMPAFAAQSIETDERGLSWLFAALGIGALAASGLLSYVGAVRRAGPWLLASNLAFAATGAAFAFSGVLWFALALAIAASFFNTIHTSIGAAALQLASTDEIRGRIFGLYEVAWGAFPLGGLVLGLIASWFGLQAAVLVGSAFTGAFTIAVLAGSPRLRSLSF